MNPTHTLLATLLVAMTAQAVEVRNLRCEYRENPLGDGEAAVYALGSGSYRFESHLAETGLPMKSREEISS